jgi:hypothetical protein
VHEAYAAGQVPKPPLDLKERLIELLREGLAVKDAMAELASST